MLGSILLHSLAVKKPVSLTDIAAKTGYTVAEITDTCNWLIEIGCPLSLEASDRIVLERTIVPLETERIRLLVSEADSELGKSFECFESIDSTNRYLMNLPAAQLRHKQVCLAEHMTAGRGRQFRKWHGGAFENVILSIAWCFSRDVQHLSGLSLAIAVIVVRCLNRFSSVRFQVKWPNDILVDGQKLSGILVELRNDAAVIGIGVNCSLTVEQRLEIGQPATSLSQVMDEPVDRSQLIAALLIDLAEGLERFSDSGLEPFRDDWLRLHAYQHRRMRVEGRPGREGVVKGIDPSGALILELDSGELMAVNSGEVTVL